MFGQKFSCGLIFQPWHKEKQCYTWTTHSRYVLKVSRLLDNYSTYTIVKKSLHNNNKKKKDNINPKYLLHISSLFILYISIKRRDLLSSKGLYECWEENLNVCWSTGWDRFESSEIRYEKDFCKDMSCLSQTLKSTLQVVRFILAFKNWPRNSKVLERKRKGKMQMMFPFSHHQKYKQSWRLLIRQSYWRFCQSQVVLSLRNTSVVRNRKFNFILYYGNVLAHVTCQIQSSVDLTFGFYFKDQTSPLTATPWSASLWVLIH